jgi:HEAT repeat protein
MVTRKYVKRLEAQKNTRALRDLLYHPDSAIRRDTARALGNIKDENAADPLIHALGDEKFCVSFAARESLVKIGKPAVESVIQAIKDNKNSYTRWTLCEILGCFEDKKTVGTLIEALHDENRFVRADAALALGRIGDVKALRALTELLNDKDSYVKKQARKALKRILRGMISQVLADKSELTEVEKQDLKDRALKLAQVLKLEIQFPETQESRRVQSQVSDEKKPGK